MDTISVQEVLAAYKALLLRALFIVDKAPYWAYVSEEKFVRISIDGDTATLLWPELEAGYEDSYSISTNACQFPAELLIVSKEQVLAWKAEKTINYEAEEAKRREQRRAENEQSERVALAALKAKYE